MNLRDYLLATQDHTNAVLVKAHELIDGLSESELNAKDSPDVWSIGQIFDHMVLAQEPYLTKIPVALENGTDGDDAEAKHTLMGRFIINSMLPGSTKQVPVPKIFEPSSGPHELPIVVHFLQLQERLLEIMDDAHGKNLNKIKVPSPVSGLIRLSLTDAFRLFNVHNDYHLAQVKSRLEATQT